MVGKINSTAQSVMVKKISIILLIVVFLLALAVWSPWQNWNLSWLNLLGIESKAEISGLKVVALEGNLDVYVDDQYVGQAQAGNGFLEISPIEPGEHLVKLTRDEDTEKYAEIVRQIRFEPAVDVVIGYELGPTEEFSEGHILSAKKSYVTEGQAVLDIFSSPENVEVVMNDEVIGETPLKSINLDISKKNKLKFTKAGYDSLELELLPENQEERDKLADLLLTLEINLFARPVNIVTE